MAWFCAAWIAPRVNAIDVVARTKRFFLVIMSIALARGNSARCDSIVHLEKAKRQFKKSSKRMKEMKEKHDAGRRIMEVGT